MALIALYIKIVSPGDSIIANTKGRVGYKGKEFKLLKFRSMIPDAQSWLESQPELFAKYKENNLSYLGSNLGSNHASQERSLILFWVLIWRNVMSLQAT
jgi:lipopolysaccharide/colanic/teichoic acid biosynthesis glycosyltransferase